MAVYRYSLKKFLKTPSTWLLLLFGALTMFFIGGFLIFWILGLHWNLKNSPELQSFSETTAFVITYSTVGSTISLMIALFAGFKGSQVFRDEIEDGTFLIILSKPLSRKRILIQKWLAFMTVFIAFIICLSLCHTLGALAAQKGNYVTKYLWMAFPLEIVISMIFMIIFSSISLISSVFLHSKGVIGVSFILGMAIVFTEFLAQFSYIPPYASIGLSRTNSDNSFIPGATSDVLYSRSKALQTKELNSDIKNVNFNDIKLKENNLYINNPNKLTTYNHLWPFDFSYHVDSIDSLVVKTILSKKDAALQNNYGQVNDEIQMKQVFNGYKDPNVIDRQYFMSNDNYTIMKILINDFQVHKNSQPMITAWSSFISLINNTNNWINNSLLKIKINKNSDDSASYTIDITEGGSDNSTPPFNNDNNNIREIWTKLLRGNSNLFGSQNFSLENLFRRFGDERFMSPTNNCDKRDFIDNNIFGLIMSYFQTQTIVNTMNKIQTEIVNVQNNKTEAQPLDISSYKYMQKGYQVLTHVAHILGVSSPTYNSDLSKVNWASLDNKIVKVKYVNFTSPYTIMTVYLAIAIILLPTSYLIIRRQDFN